MRQALTIRDGAQDSARAKKTYEQFFAFWKDADADSVWLLDMRPRYDRSMPQQIEFSPIGMVHSPVVEAVNDIWDGVKCRIDLDSSRFTPDCLSG